MHPASALTVETPSAFYAEALSTLEDAGIPFLIGGAFAFSHYSRIRRETKDLDVFVRPDDCRRALAVFEAKGYDAELLFPHWLGKVRSGEYFIDLIFSSGNGLARVDDLWFEHAPKAHIFGLNVRLSPPEEMIWSKTFVQERERFDGADVLHIIRELGRSLDWERLLMRFADHWRVLLSHVVLFGYVYPDERDQVPAWVIEELTGRLTAERPELDNRLCYGTFLSREQYLPDLDEFGYHDARLEPDGPMTRRQIETWTAAIDDRKDG